MVDVQDIPAFGNTFGVIPYKNNYDVTAVLAHSSAAANILWPNENLQLTLKLVNNTAKEVSIRGSLAVIAHPTKGIERDIWTPAMFKINDVEKLPFTAIINSRWVYQCTIKS